MSKTYKCYYCKGFGVTGKTSWWSFEEPEEQEQCPYCNGSGLSEFDEHEPDPDPKANDDF
jgi:DnaJ-class molecular chaperone